MTQDEKDKENCRRGHHDWMSLRYCESEGDEIAIAFCCIFCPMYCEEMVSRN